MTIHLVSVPVSIVGNSAGMVMSMGILLPHIFGFGFVKQSLNFEMMTSFMDYRFGKGHHQHICLRCFSSSNVKAVPSQIFSLALFDRQLCQLIVARCVVI